MDVTSAVSLPTGYPTSQPTSTPTQHRNKGGGPILESLPTGYPTSQPTSTPTQHRNKGGGPILESLPTGYPTSQPTSDPTQHRHGGAGHTFAATPTGSPSSQPTSKPSVQSLHAGAGKTTSTYVAVIKVSGFSSCQNFVGSKAETLLKIVMQETLLNQFSAKFAPGSSSSTTCSVIASTAQTALDVSPASLSLSYEILFPESTAAEDETKFAQLLIATNPATGKLNLSEGFNAALASSSDPSLRALSGQVEIYTTLVIGSQPNGNPKDNTSSSSSSSSSSAELLFILIPILSSFFLLFFCFVTYWCVKSRRNLSKERKWALDNYSMGGNKNSFDPYNSVVFDLDGGH